MAASVNKITEFNDCRFLIMGHVQPGFGDISATLKLLEVIKKYAPLENLALTIANDAECHKKLMIFSKLLDGVKIISFSATDDCYDSIEKFNPSIVVLFHGLSLVSRRYELKIEHTKKPVIQLPAVVFEEYNNIFEAFVNHHSTDLKPVGASYSLGIHSSNFNPDPSRFCLGIFQDQKLVEYYRDPNSKNALNRLKTHAMSLNPNLYRAVIGDKPIEKFEKKTSLYFGYANNYHKADVQTAFIGAAVLLNRASQKDIVVILPGRFKINTFDKLSTENLFGKDGNALSDDESDINALEPSIFELSESEGVAEPVRTSDLFFNFLKEENFTSLEIVSWDEKTQQSTLIRKWEFDNPLDDKKMDRSVKVLSGDFSHHHFIELMLASEREVLCTGDQSLGEALSAGKKIYYEVLAHKLDLSNSLSDLIKRKCHVDVSFRDSRYTIKKGTIQERCIFMKKLFDSIDTHWDRFINHIHRKQNCEKRIVEALNSFFDGVRSSKQTVRKS